LLNFLTTRTHNTWSSQRILFLKISNLSYIFLKIEKAIPGRGEGVRGAKKVLCQRLEEEK
jgi:hypothetical protein